MSGKVCKDCGERKELSEFYRQPKMADGRFNSCKECRRAYQKDRPLEATSAIERKRNQKAARKAHLAKNLKKWRRKNPAKAAARRDRRRALERGADGNYTAEEFLALCEVHANTCLRCGRSDKPLTPDHVVPLSLGGSNLIVNIQPLCRSCNSRKNIKIVDYRSGDVALEGS